MPFLLRFFDSNFDPYIKQSIRAKLTDISEKSTIALQSVLHNQYHEIEAHISTPLIILPSPMGEIYTITAGELHICSLKSHSDDDPYSHFELNVNGFQFNVNH